MAARGRRPTFNRRSNEIPASAALTMKIRRKAASGVA
jgi:hypothetical protein